jgi:hypothetical protein
VTIKLYLNRKILNKHVDIRATNERLTNESRLDEYFATTQEAITHNDGVCDRLQGQGEDGV